MQITLNENEIKRAIIAFVSDQGISITGKNVEVSLTAGRAPNGMSASIDISNDDPVPLKNVVVNVTEEAPAKEATGLVFNQAVGKAESAGEESGPPFDDNAAQENKPLFGKN